jgi:integrase
VVGPAHRAKTIKALLDALVQDFELRKVRSLKSIKSHMKSVEGAFGDWKVVELTEDAVNRYISARVKAGHANASIKELRDFTRWGFLTGWRKGEIASLRWADVDREGDEGGAPEEGQGVSQSRVFDTEHAQSHQRANRLPRPTL